VLRARNLVPGERPDLEDQVRRKVMGRVLRTAKVTLSPSISVLLSNGVRLPAQVQKFSPPVSLQEGQTSGRDLALLKVEGEGFPVLPLANSREAKIGDPLHILGFPGVVLSHELLNQSSTVEASVTNGAISGFKEDRSNQPMIQTDAPAAWGNSGGPAVTDQGGVVGVLTFVSLAPGPGGSIVQGFNFIIPSEAVGRFVEGTEARPGSASEFNTLWWAGLRHMFEQRFTQAEKRFEAANALFPDLPDVQRMLAEAEDKIKNPPPRPFPWPWVALGVTTVSLAGFGTIWGRRWWKNRYRILPSDVVRLLEGGRKPLILDVRKETAYEAMPIKVPGSVYIKPEEIERDVSLIEPDHSRPVLAYCS
ncbi:MAG: trypsin-like peptidase domain-containing protein, partial [Candidatus Methylomirabilales bacterium]